MFSEIWEKKVKKDIKFLLVSYKTNILNFKDFKCIDILLSIYLYDNFFTVCKPMVCVSWLILAPTPLWKGISQNEININLIFGIPGLELELATF